jgi:hypothetical protein
MVNGKKIEAEGNGENFQASILGGFVVIKVMVDVCKNNLAMVILDKQRMAMV